jgi:hypothetical protein
MLGSIVQKGGWPALGLKSYTLAAGYTGSIDTVSIYLLILTMYTAPICRPPPANEVPPNFSMISFVCLATHEFGHVVGAADIYDVCDCSAFTDLSYQDRLVQFPTMASLQSCLGNGMWDPYYLIHNLSFYETEVLETLYPGVVSIEQQESGDIPSLDLPESLEISIVAPNPFNPCTTVWLDIPRSGGVTLAVHDLHGRLVRTLLSGQMSEGRHPVVWDGMDDRGAQAPSGVYLVRLVTADGQQRAVKVTLSK